MDLYLKVRRAYFHDGLSGRAIARDFGICRDSVAKMLAYLPLIERKIMAFDQTHHVNILEMNGESYRLNQSRAKRMTP